MTRRIALAALAALIMMAGAAAARAHEGHEHTLMGTVTMAATDHVMFTDKDGKGVTVHLTKATKVARDKKTMSVADIATGMRIVAVTVEEKGKMMAKTIELGPAPEGK